MIISIRKLKRLIIIAAVILIPFICINLINVSMGEKTQTVNKVSDEQNLLDLAVKSNLQKNETSSISFFAEYRMERERVRGKQTELLREIANNPDTDKKAREVAALKLVDASDQTEKEMQAETMIKSKGYKDCAVLIETGNATVIVEYDKLPAEQEDEIRKAVGTLTGYNGKNITVVTRQHYR